VRRTETGPKSIFKSPPTAVVRPESVKSRAFYILPEGLVQRGFLKVRSESPWISPGNAEFNRAAWPAGHAACETQVPQKNQNAAAVRGRAVPWGLQAPSIGQ
jgi:hypothetical protein